MQLKIDRLNLVTRETLAGIRVVRAFVRTRHEEARFDEVNADLTLGQRTLFVDQTADGRVGSPDGMKVDTTGRLWTTGAGGVSVHTPEGEYLGVFELDEHAANIAFGGPRFSTLFLTTATSVHSIETAVTGIAPGSPR